MDPADNDRGGYVGRGALKLAAGFELLGGEEKIRGCRAIDVGASTGGFTQRLLESGAGQVTAVDVGHDQLHADLRADARVVNLERINFKTVSLHVAPGPFDFFVVDVSFVAARTMLRPLAFRLRPGAEGFILIKPQFELPDGYVWKGDVKAPGLRTWAVSRVVKKGEELGFRLLGEVDSPVVGGSGTVEILSRWVYDGPTAKMARTGDAPRPAAKTAPRAAPQHLTKRRPNKPAAGTPTKPGAPRPAAPRAHAPPAPEGKPRGSGGGYADPNRPARPPPRRRRRT